jgi:4-amino-4-deoxy-L-arabinose transferase-like glycosyltransferase
MVGGAGVAVARAFGASDAVRDLHAMRAVFFLFACLAVVAVYLLATWLFESPLAGLAGAVTFASFKGFALDAPGGPDAKTPGIFFAVLALALVVRRSYFWAAFVGSLAFLVWQPLLIYPAIAVGVAALTAEAGRRWASSARALAGATIPVVATAAYLLAARAFDDFVDGAFVFPVTDLRRVNESLTERFARIWHTVNDSYHETAVLFWLGLAMLLALLVVRVVRRRSDLLSLVHDDPYVNVVLASFLPVAAYSVIDFQGYPDAYPLLPYAALGIAAGVALLGGLARERLRAVAAGGVAAGVVALVALSWVWYSGDRSRERGLQRQVGIAAEFQRVLEPDDTVYALGNAMPLVMLQRRNPSPYIYLASGLDRWVVRHTPGGLDGWTREIQADDPGMIILGGPWRSRYAKRMREWLEGHYFGVPAGKFVMFLDPALQARAEREGLAGTP